MNPSLSNPKTESTVFQLSRDVNMHQLPIYDEESYYHPSSIINPNTTNSPPFSTMNDNHLPFNTSSNDYSLTDYPIYSPDYPNFDKTSPMLGYNNIDNIGSPQLLSLNNPLQTLNSPQFNVIHTYHNNHIESKPFSLTQIPQNNLYLNNNIPDINNHHFTNNLTLERSISNCSQSATTISSIINNNSNNSIHHYSVSPQSPSAVPYPSLHSNNNNNNMSVDQLSLANTNQNIPPNIPNIPNIPNLYNSIHNTPIPPQIPQIPHINTIIDQSVIDNILMTPQSNKSSENTIANDIIPLQTPPNIDICNTSHMSPPLIPLIIPTIPTIPKLPLISQILEENNNINTFNNNDICMNDITLTDDRQLNVIHSSVNEINIKSIKKELTFNYISTNNNINITPIPLITKTKPKPNTIINDHKKMEPIKIKKLQIKPIKKLKKQLKKTTKKTNIIKTPNSKTNKKINQAKIIKTRSQKKKAKLYENCNDNNLNINTKKKSEDIRRIKNPKTRRKHTAIACIKCWKAKTRCSIKRPCDRCVRIGCQDQCVDRPPSSRKRQNVTKANSKNNTVKRKSNIKKKHNKNCNNNKCSHLHLHIPIIEPPKPQIPKRKPVSLSSLSTVSPTSKKPYSVATTSLSEIMSSFKRNNNKSNAYPIAILKSDPSFIYLPLLTHFQIHEKEHCKKCFALLETLNSNCIDTHLQIPHNYKCPNKNCQREFVLQNHLGIHLKICQETQKLSNNHFIDLKKLKLLNQNQFNKYINYTIKSPIDNYYKIVNHSDIYPTNKWIQKQQKTKIKTTTKQKRKNNKKIKLEYTPPNKKRKINEY